MSNPDDLLSSQETAALLGIKNNTLELWRGQGKGPKFAKLGDAPQAPVKYRRSDVLAWIEERLFSSTSHYTASLNKLRDYSTVPGPWQKPNALPEAKRVEGATE